MAAEFKCIWHILLKNNNTETLNNLQSFKKTATY